MAWPYDENIRPYIRMASYWLGEGRDVAWIMQWARDSAHHYNLADMAQAIPEAVRANYFRARIEAANPDMPLSQLWGLASRGAWYAGYGRAPTEEEREWAYTRPQEMLGLQYEVVGRGARTGQYRHYRINLNVDWGMSPAEAEQYVRDMIVSGSIITGDQGSEALRAGGLMLTLGGGALLERQIRGSGPGEVL